MHYTLFVDSIRRLYKERRIAKEKVMELHKNKKITDEECEYILSAITNVKES